MPLVDTREMFKRAYDGGWAAGLADDDGALQGSGHWGFLLNYNLIVIYHNSHEISTPRDVKL